LEGAGGGGQGDVSFCLSFVDPKDCIKQAKMTMASSRTGRIAGWHEGIRKQDVKKVRRTCM